MAHPEVTAAKVPTTATTTLRNVMVLTSHPNPLARNSNRSALNGQMFGSTIGERRGNVCALGIQMPDWKEISQSRFHEFGVVTG